MYAHTYVRMYVHVHPYTYICPVYTYIHCISVMTLRYIYVYVCTPMHVSVLCIYACSRICLHCPVLCILEDMLTVSPNRQYRGMAEPITPATTGPACTGQPVGRTYIHTYTVKPHCTNVSMGNHACCKGMYIITYECTYTQELDW